MTASIRRGDIFLVDFDPTRGAETRKTRPSVVVSNNINNLHSPIVSIAPITSNVGRIFSFEVKMPAGSGGLTSDSKIMINQTRAVDKSRLIKKLGSLSADLLIRVDKALRIHFAL